jgi:Ser/Thr protein kinase RdoA (MazF antagonist)
MPFVALLRLWSLDEPWTVERACTGGNNLVYPVTTPSGRYLLRIHQNTSDPERLRYEHAILVHLGQSRLSFAVPAPISASSGATIVPVPDAEGRTLAALFPLIPGQHPQGSEQQRRGCGRALAELDRTFAQIALPAPPGTLAPFGYLWHLHPAVPDLGEMLETLPLEPLERVQLSRLANQYLAQRATI